MPTSRPPKYRLHKATGKAVVTIRLPDGRRHAVYLGPYGSDASRREYARGLAGTGSPVANPMVAEPARPAAPTVSELLLQFKRHAEAHYRHPDGTPTTELHNFALSVRPVRELFGDLPAAEFGPRHLKAVRDRMIEKGWCRTQINGRVGRIKRAWKWAVSEEMVPVEAYHRLKTVAGLEAGRSAARELEKVRPVTDEAVLATLPFLTRHVAGLVTFQRLTGCRPGEACSLRMSDVDTSGPVWLYKPGKHKLAYRNKPRVIPIGPKAQALLAGFPTAAPAEFVFSPRKAVAEYHAARTASRKTPRYASHVRRNEGKRATAPERRPNGGYTVTAYGHAVAKAVGKANVRRGRLAAGADFEPVPHWHPNQLRHASGTEIRRRFGADAAQAVLGHSRLSTTEIYAEPSARLASDVASEIG
jgi:integrase